VGIRDRTLPLIHVGDNDPECALAQASQNSLRLAETGAVRPYYRIPKQGFPCLQAQLYFDPEPLPEGFRRNLRFASLISL